MFSLFSPKVVDLTKKPAFPLANHSDFLWNAMYSNNKTTFNLMNTDHTDLLRVCTDLQAEKLKQLKAIDLQLAIGFSIGIAAFVLSFIFPVALFTIAGFAYGSYQLALRQHMFNEYSQSLDNLMNCVKWSTGVVSNRDAQPILASKIILNMLAGLIPITTEQQLYDVMDDKIEKQALASAIQKAHEDGDATFADIKLDEHQKKLYYTVYGFEQGNAVQVLTGIGHEIVNGFTYLKNAMFGPTVDATQDNNNTAPVSSVTPPQDTHTSSLLSRFM